MKKNWKDYLTDLRDNLPAVGIDPSKFQEAMKRLPVERFTSETYSKLSSRAKYGASEIGVGLTILDRIFVPFEMPGRFVRIGKVWPKRSMMFFFPCTRRPGNTLTPGKRRDTHTGES